MKTEKTNKEIANDITEIGAHLFIEGGKAWLKMFSVIFIQVVIQIFTLVIGQFALGFAINCLILAGIGLKLRKIKKKKGEM
jgi:uncharacterized membrane protein YciS (DUF1049 family)